MPRVQDPYGCHIPLNPETEMAAGALVRQGAKVKSKGAKGEMHDLSASFVRVERPYSGTELKK